MSAPNPEKGKRYLAQLDQALCNGNWADVPELARKTDKHAPDRRCKLRHVGHQGMLCLLRPAILRLHPHSSDGGSDSICFAPAHICLFK